jgi:hypothetical protein
MENFRSACEAQLKSSDREALKTLLDGSDTPASHKFVRQWQACDTQLRNAAARLRAARRNASAVNFVRNHPGFQVSIEHGVEAAFDAPTPLERERALDQLRWTLLDELAGPNPFSTSHIFAYAIKLQIAARWASMNRQKGEDKIRNSIENKNSNSRASTASADSGA